MSGPDRAELRHDCGNDAAPYVLGALEPAEAQRFAHHLQSCAVCRDEVAALAPVLRVLPAFPPRYEVSAALRRRVMLTVRSEPKAARARHAVPPPRRGHWSLRAATALALSLAALIAVAVSLEIGSGGSATRVIRASVGDARLQIAGGHGELIVDHLPPSPPDRVYELWLQRGQRTPAPSTLFAVTSRDTAVLGVPGDLTGITRVLVTVEPSGGSRMTTSRPVILARL